MSLCPEQDSEVELHRIGLVFQKSCTIQQLQKIKVRFMRKSVDLNHHVPIGRSRLMDKR